MEADFHITRGFAETERNAIATLYWEAFGGKLAFVLGPCSRAIPFLAQCLRPDFALVARDIETDQAIGVLGLKTERGSLNNGMSHGFSQHYGRIGAYWRQHLLAMYAQPEPDDALMIDGLSVTAVWQHRGVGLALLNAAEAQACLWAKPRVQLEVMDGNTRAIDIYTQFGFQRIETLAPPLTRLFFGYSRSFTLSKTL